MDSTPGEATWLLSVTSNYCVKCRTAYAWIESYPRANINALYDLTQRCA